MRLEASLSPVPWDTPEGVWGHPGPPCQRDTARATPGASVSAGWDILGSPPGFPLAHGFRSPVDRTVGMPVGSLLLGLFTGRGSGRVQPETLFQEVLPPARDVPRRGRTWKLFPWTQGTCGSCPWIGRALVCALNPGLCRSYFISPRPAARPSFLLAPQHLLLLRALVKPIPLVGRPRTRESGCGREL